MVQKTTKKTSEAKLTFGQVDQIIKNDTQRTKEYLDSQPKINFIIPLGIGEKEGSFETVCINGYLIQIKKGSLVLLPQSVVEMLAEKYKIEMEAGSKMRIDRSSDVQQALE